MYFQNPYFKETDKKLRLLVAKGDIKGLASLAAELQADAVAKMYLLDDIDYALTKTLSVEDASTIMVHALNKHILENPYKTPSAIRNIPTESLNRWIDFYKFVKEWCIENEKENVK